MLALVTDYESFCSDMDLLPRDEYMLFVPACGQSFEVNERLHLYYCPETYSRRKTKYLGIYAQKSVRAIGQIAKIVACAVNIDTNDVAMADAQNTLTQNEQERILEATREARVRNWNLTTGHKFYLCDTMHETAFNKTSLHGLRNFRYFDLEEVLGGKVPQDVGALAASLRQRTWE